MSSTSNKPVPLNGGTDFKLNQINFFIVFLVAIFVGSQLNLLPSLMEDPSHWQFDETTTLATTNRNKQQNEINVKSNQERQQRRVAGNKQQKKNNITALNNREDQQQGDGNNYHKSSTRLGGGIQQEGADDGKYSQLDDEYKELANLRDRCGDKLLVVNIHVPKTGGSTVVEALRTCTELKGNKTFLHGHTSSFFHMSTEKQRQAGSIDGHIGYGMHLQPNFPQDRKDCTVYIAMVRKLPEIVWSDFRYHLREKNFDRNKNRNEIETFKEEYKNHLTTEDKTRVLNPWNFRGSISYQLCCYHDFQHPSSKLYDDNGNYVDHPERSKMIYNYTSQDFRNVDPNCPASYQERMNCAFKRLCKDFAIVGDIDNPQSVGTFFRKLSVLMGNGCNLDRFIPSQENEKGVRINPTSWPSFDSYAAELIHTVLSKPGAIEDLSLMEFGTKLAAAGGGADKNGICNEFADQ